MGDNGYIKGFASSPDFPTANALQPVLSSPNGNAFVAKLSAVGSALVYSTFLGGSDPSGDGGNAIALDAFGNAYVTGYTYSADFPTVNAVQPTHGGRGCYLGGSQGYRHGPRKLRAASRNYWGSL
jgi:hypothetical protein